MWDEIMDMPGEIFDVDDMSLTFDDIVEGMANDPEFIEQCERNNREWDEEAAAELEMTVDELHHFLGV
jgi:hypothetical protein